MIPVMLDPARLRIALAGRGELAARRLAWFERLGARLQLFCDVADDVFAQAAGAGRVGRLPTDEDLACIDVIWIAGLNEEPTAALVAAAKAARVIVNVEDDLRYCDFHTPAIVKRGQLTIAAGTGGSSPAVAGAVRARIEETFPEAWATVLDEISAARAKMRAAGASMAEVAADARRRLAEAKLL